MNLRRWLGPVASLLLLACSSSDDVGTKAKTPLALGEASAALCGGGANRKGDSDDPNGGGDNGGAVGSGGSSGTWTTTTGTAEGGAGQGGAGGMGKGGAGGQGGFAGAGGEGGAAGQGGFAGAGGQSTGGAAGQGGFAGAGGQSTGGAAAWKGPRLQTQAPAGNCGGIDLSTPLELYMSADDSNSMASPTIVRSQIRRGQTTFDRREIRTYEFLNYYRFAFPAAPDGTLSILAQLGSCVLTGDVALQVAVTSPAAPAKRAPINLTLVLDTSGSMEGAPIARERAAVAAIAAALQEGDVVSAVTWSDDQLPVMEGHVVTGPDDPAIVSLAASLQANGSTNLDAGLRAGYDLALKYRAADRLNRVVLISDGQANVGVTSEELIGDNAEDEDAEGTYLVGVGVGDGVNDTLMNVVTDAGRGAYVYLDSEEEAARIFADRFAETVLVAARDVRIKLVLPPYFKIQQFFGEEYSPDPAKVRPQNLAPGDSMMLYQILRPCDATLPSAEDPIAVEVTWRDAIDGTPRSALQATTLGALGIDDGNLAKATAIIAYAEALKQLADLDAPARQALLDQTKALVDATAAGGTDADLAEISDLLAKLGASTLGGAGGAMGQGGGPGVGGAQP